MAESNKMKDIPENKQMIQMREDNYGMYLICLD